MVETTAEPTLTGEVPVERSSTRGPRPRRRRRRHNSYTAAPLFLITTNLLLFSCFFAWPAAIGLWYSFTSYTGVGSAPFVGLDNYSRLVHDSEFFHALVRTMMFTAGAVPLTYVMALGTATLLISANSRGKQVARVVFFLPWLISPIIAGVIFRWIFGENFGLVNYVLIKLGGHALEWQSSANLSLAVMIIAEAWCGTAFNMLLFIAAMKNVPTSYYEAASLDGAGAWAKFRYITLPAIAPTSFIIVLLSTIGTMKEYGLILALNNGGPGTENNLLVQYIYTTGFKRGQIGYASSASFVLMLILMVIAIVQITVNRRMEASR